ncbi:MAG TPA: restriction endonuclease subunit S [Alphaproteobacteria bacterium]|nr:restriction endonuclease subunit S [Alphaproteobacteria bacterium]
MKSGWVEKNLKDLCKVDWGNTNLTKSSYIEDGAFLAVSAAGCDGRIGHKEHSKYTPVLSAIGAQCGKMFFPEEDFTAIKNTITLTPKEEKIQGKFLYYLFTFIKLPQRGAGQPFISKGDIERFAVSIPPLREQKQIVAILDEAFEGIAAATANAEKNLANARELFDTYLNSIFTKQGDGWIDTPLGKTCGFVRGPFGGSLKKSIFVSSGYAIYEQQHAIYNQFDDVRYFINDKKFKEMQRFELFPDDLIMSCSGTMGRVAIVPKDIKRGIINQALLKLTPTDKILNTFLKFWMESEAFQDALSAYSGGAAIQNVASVKILKEIKIPLPPIKVQSRIVESIDRMRKETQRLEDVYQKKLSSLAELKQSLLQKAFAGELTTETAKAAKKEAVA